MTATNRNAGWFVGYSAFMVLVHAGVACHGPDCGGESTFVHQKHCLPLLPWHIAREKTVCADLAMRYPSTHGPATPTDLGSWFGVSVAQAKRWIADAGDLVVDVDLDGRRRVLCATDIDDLKTKPPAPGRWPVRLL